MKIKAGILLHITSLPGKEGIGTLGKEAHQFVDYLAAGQRTWQECIRYIVLPSFITFSFYISLLLN